MFVVFFCARNKSALTELFSLTGGRILRHKRFLERCHKWCNAPPRSLKWARGDCEQPCMRLRIMQMHCRDARRDGKCPPQSAASCQALLNMISTNALEDDIPEDDEE